jgi:membrane protein implicated in regulation of membrane protease activity
MQDLFEWMQDHQWQTWLGFGITLGVLEMFSLDLIMIMLAGGAFVGMFAALLGLPVGVQIVLAAGSSVAMLALVRPSMVRRLQGGPDLTLGHDKLVGARGVVTEQISSLQTGRVKLGGEVWSAEPYDESLTIAAGEVVEVLEIRGATAFVHPVHAIGQ